MTTAYHSKYFAYELTRKFSSSQASKLSQSLLNATVDLNPHQIDAALFAFRSPLSRGAVLADEVGLGKTIEAALIISQLWAEKKRRILCLVPAALRQQWVIELLEKFFIESVILESRSYNQALKEGLRNPFDRSGKVVICSYQFARAKDRDLAAVAWDLVVIDEAHRLRNVYKKDNKIGRAIRDAVGNKPKVLLTATPLQNSLMELYGLVSFIDPHLFGSPDSFRDIFVKPIDSMRGADFEALRARLRPICQRTLRRQVLEYVPYTNRVPITQDFTPTSDEMKLYELVSDYLQRPDAAGLPKSQRALMTLVLRKILASSSFAITATLGSLISRLETLSSSMVPTGSELAETLAEDYEGLGELDEEWSEPEDIEEDPSQAPISQTQENREAKLRLELIRKEIGDLKDYKKLAESIASNAKGEALLKALKTGFAKAAQFGAAPKALIFTESKRTQQYLRKLLGDNGYSGQTVILNGTNSDEDSARIYAEWLKRREGQDCITGSPSADRRSALVEEFRDKASIMIATESGAEGLNLQFCSLVVNYDLPWNPQRIEQRIGRCHRYGQEHDVVVINFLNRGNAADQRVFQLLSEKLRLFDGVFGASDEVLGALGSGVDFEKRIHDIYQSCRKPEDIASAFDSLQAELDEKIRVQMQDTRAKLLEHFDEDVQSRLRLSRAQTDEQVDRYSNLLWKLTRTELGADADFPSEGYTFTLKRVPEALDPFGIALGPYRLVTVKNGTEDHHYRLGHPLAEQLLNRAKQRELPARQVTFRYGDKKISLVESLRGASGWLRLYLLAVETDYEKEERLIFSASREDGTPLDQETCEKLFGVPGTEGDRAEVPADVIGRFESHLTSEKVRILGEIAERNERFFEEEMEKLEGWAEDLKLSLEREIKDLDREIRAAKKEARQAADLETKVAMHKKAKDLERRRNEKRHKLYEAQDEIDSKKDGLLSEIEGKLKQRTEVAELFTVRWRVE